MIIAISKREKSGKLRNSFSQPLKAIAKCPFKGANGNSPPFQRRVYDGISFFASFFFLSCFRDSKERG